jgi:hypothetical protein
MIDFFFSRSFIKDVSTTLLVKPGPVVDFVLQNQNVQKPNLIDWTKVILLLHLEVEVLCLCVYEL